MLSPQLSNQVPPRLSVFQICILSPGIWSVNTELMLENYNEVHKFLLHLTGKLWRCKRGFLISSILTTLGQNTYRANSKERVPHKALPRCLEVGTSEKWNFLTQTAGASFTPEVISLNREGTYYFPLKLMWQILRSQHSSLDQLL